MLATHWGFMKCLAAIFPQVLGHKKAGKKYSPYRQRHVDLNTRRHCKWTWSTHPTGDVCVVIARGKKRSVFHRFALFVEPNIDSLGR